MRDEGEIILISPVPKPLCTKVIRRKNGEMMDFLAISENKVTLEKNGGKKIIGFTNLN